VIAPRSATCCRLSSVGGTAVALTAAFGHGQFGFFAGWGWSGFGAGSGFGSAAHRGQPFTGTAGAAFVAVGVGGEVVAQQHGCGPVRIVSR